MITQGVEFKKPMNILLSKFSFCCYTYSLKSFYISFSTLSRKIEHIVHMGNAIQAKAEGF